MTADLVSSLQTRCQTAPAQAAANAMGQEVLKVAVAVQPSIIEWQRTQRWVLRRAQAVLAGQKSE
jgi:hypothetical protein